jgi:hypothetical protein
MDYCLLGGYEPEVGPFETDHRYVPAGDVVGMGWGSARPGVVARLATELVGVLPGGDMSEGRGHLGFSRDEVWSVLRRFPRAAVAGLWPTCESPV